MQINRPKSEEKIIRTWKQRQIFKKSLDKKGGDFVFYEGPPTANAKPGVHHVDARVFKDIICRYKTMQGFKVLRKAGWDIHGLPVELAVEKALGLKSKKDIEKYGIAKFNEKCRESVWQYAQDWTNLTERIGFWLDLDEPYITGSPFYMETVFNIIKQISDKGLLFQDYKVVPYCPRCGTGLSSHEVAQGYKKIKEPAVYVRFKIKGKKFKSNTYLLVWTTTPWTLPGNVAIAVNPKITYVLAKVDKEYLIVAKERQEVLGEKFKIVKKLKGKDIIGLNYKPLFDKKIVVLPRGVKNIYKVLSADFVTTEEGTGLVHIAPAFGQDDMELVKSQKQEFPILLTVDEEGKFKKEVKKWAGIFVKQADPLIIEHLQKTGHLFKQEKYEHDYPFCWRCGTPLLYYAKKSWFIKTTAVKEELIKNNKKINWMPEHIKQGRFGEWLNELKDWAISRERYWGTPLPIWKCEKCEHQEVIGSREDLKKQKFSTNKYFVLRHGEAESNAQGYYCSYPEPRKTRLTDKGIKQIKEVIPKLKKIDLIFASDLLRTSQTAGIVAKALKIKIKYDKRLREVDIGTLNGKPVQEGYKFFNPQGKLNKQELVFSVLKQGFPNGENGYQVRRRILDFLKDIDREYQNKRILIVTHELSIISLETSMKGFNMQESAVHRVKYPIDTGELNELDYKTFPYNEKGELDFHRPYIDKIEFICPKCGKPMKRVPEVIDCWFDSGSMPFSQNHWPFSSGDKPTVSPDLFPADYISEAIDQTRGWFYTLLAISTLLGFESPYKNVVVLGHVLDEKGQKMSKSKGNVVDPWEMIEKYGADALRWYFYTINQPWDTKLFAEKDVEQRLKKFVMTLWNCYTFFETYTQDSKFEIDSKPKIQNVLDKWILSRLNGLIQEATDKLDNYDITGAARAIEGFVINDLSLWYIRRSRKRFQKPDTKQELSQASFTLAHTLLDLVKLMAPFAPFISEDIYLGLTAQKNQLSVHLDKWPKPKKVFVNKELEKKMQLVRDVVALGLKIRNNEKIKVRQPLLKLKIQNPKSKISQGFIDLIKEELNIKEVEIAEKITKESGWKIEGDKNLKIALNTKITAELEEEGWLREIGRQIQIMRKDAGCKPKDKIVVYYTGDKELTRLLARNKELLLSQIRAKDLIAHRKEKQAFNIEKQFQISSHNLWLGLKIVVK